MAIKPCRECGKDVSTGAPKCPHCGVPWPTQPKVTLRAAGIGAATVLGLFVVFAIIGSQIPDPPATVDSAPPAPSEVARTETPSITLADMAEAKGEAWINAGEEMQMAFSQASVAIVDRQRNVGLDAEGHGAMSAWLKLCMDREAPSHPARLLTDTVNACLQSMTADDLANIVTVQQAARKLNGK
ncbi:MAG TPA: zinc ribbon domain-containing protein [Burkholderiales bacterium]|nr:zinc ribbon domain-containing protein [Burkholderiales bacterium]